MTTKTIKDYYTLFELTPNATQDEIRQAYRRLARTCHPDISTAPNAEERFKELNAAYAVLADPAKRKIYDSLTLTGDPVPPPEPRPTPPPDITSSLRSTPAAPRATPPPAYDQEPASAARPFPPTWAVLLILVGLCIIVGISAAALRTFLPLNRPAGGAEAVAVHKLATFDTPPPPPQEAVIQEGGVPLLTVLPDQLQLAGQTFTVIPVTPEQGRWPVPAPDQGADKAVWIHGTVINYVIGLPYTTTTESMLSGLDSAARITLTLANGAQLIFGSPQAQRVAADDLTPMAQQQPGMTLVLLGAGQSNRLIARARYLPEESIATESQQRVDGLNVTILQAGVAHDEGNTRYFVVEYQVTNETANPVDPAFFDLSLEGSEGQRYAPNEDATARGQYGKLQAPIPAGGSATGSVGYLIPRDIQPPLTWVFRADPASANTLRNVLPYEAPQPGPAQPSVELTSAFADGARNVIVINGTVRNLGETALSVTLADVSLTSSAGSSSLMASTPLLPWSIQPGQSQTFELQFNRPANAASALLNILGFTFQIEGLP